MGRLASDRRIHVVWGTGAGRQEGAFRRVFPFRRHWPAIGVLAAFDAVFLWPAVITFGQAVSAWRTLDALHDLVGAVFLTAWLLGWSMAPLAMTLILLLMLLGQERIEVTPRRLEIVIGLPWFGLGMRFDPAEIGGLHYQASAPRSGRSWRGPHLAFDSGKSTVAFGSYVDAGEADRLIHEIETAAAGRLGRKAPGPARDDPLAAGEGAGSIAALGGLGGIEPGHAPDEPGLDRRPPQADRDPGTARRRLTPAMLALVAANLVPVFGAAFLGWKLSDVMVLYWAESAIIGFYNLLKIAVIGRWAALFAGPFFVGHYGGFMAVHFLFIYTIFVQGADAGTGDDLASVGALFRDLAPALLALFASHGLSFFQNFLGRREFEGRTVKDQMTEPYSRIVFMHLVLIIGGGIALVLGEPTPVILGVIALKIAFDLRAHRREHLA